MTKTLNPKKEFRDKVFRWESYKAFFNITILRYLVLWFTIVPLLAGLMKSVDSPLIIQTNGSPIVLRLDLPFSWQLLWLASFCFFLALAIYYLRCPSFVKKYNNYSDYLSFCHDPRWLAWEARDLVVEKQGLDRLVDRLSTKGYLREPAEAYVGKENPVVGEKQTLLHFHHRNRNFVLALPVLDSRESPDKEAERGIFWEIFGRYSGARLGSRVCILVLLTIGAACFILVLGQHVWAGLFEVWTWVASSLAELCERHRICVCAV